MNHPSQRTAKYGDNAPEAADLYFSYGKALLENAIAQTSVLGKDQTEDALEKGALLVVCRNQLACAKVRHV